jgi:ppGpp synthetase/RelA/SpoT-type nucleotidyltranferase
LAISMTLISEFISQYRGEYSFYQNISELCAQQCESALEESGIRAIVSFRAKRPDRLEAKVRRRANRIHYRSLNDIYDDIVDLAGARISLYFPGDREQVGQVIREQFDLIEPPKDFPTASTTQTGKRFSGYWATHYHVCLMSGKTHSWNERFAQVKIEIQVASVLMHAWAEVEHDLAYKQLDGGLSDEEYAILDELNGLVLAGEIALERLQKAVEARIQNLNRPFNNHYELAAYLYDKVRAQQKGSLDEVKLPMGRADILLNLLRKAALDQPHELSHYLAQVHLSDSRMSVADQITEHIIHDNPALRGAYRNILRQMQDYDAPATVLGEEHTE